MSRRSGAPELPDSRAVTEMRPLVESGVEPGTPEAQRLAELMDDPLVREALDKLGDLSDLARSEVSALISG